MKYVRTSPPFSGLTKGYSGPRSNAWDVTDRATRMDRDGADIIHLGVGDPDFDTPAGIIDTAMTSLRSGRTHYSPIPGESELRNAIAETCTDQYGTEIEAAQVCIFPGAQCALFATMLCLAGPGDEVILLEPFYATYEGVAQAGGATVVTVPLSADDDFSLDIDRVANAITDKTRVILMNSPGNPSGAVFDEASILSLTELCREKNIWLISDEVYSQLIFDAEHYSPLSIPITQDNVVVISSVSKTYAMTGWRLGWTIAPPELVSHLTNLSQCLLFGVSQFTQDAVTYALRNEQQQVAAFCTSFEHRRDTFCDALEKIDGLTVHRPGGGMFTMVDVSALDYDGEQFANELLGGCGVAVVPGFAFGDSVRNCVRIGYLCDERRLIEAAKRIEKFVARRITDLRK
jgi:arginine:pyruvate transaminase